VERHARAERERDLPRQLLLIRRRQPMNATKLSLLLGATVVTAVPGVIAHVPGEAREAFPSRYAVANVQYALNATEPGRIEGVTFTIDPISARSVRVRLSTTGAWHHCENAEGLVQCPIDGTETTATVGALSVAAVGGAK
jgi:hypothetical protein